MSRRIYDYAECAREPIHIPGCLQPHGAVLVFDATTWTVREASQNCGDLLGIELDDLLGQPVSKIFGRGLTQSLQDASRFEEPAPVGDVPPCHGGGILHALAHHRAGRVILELEPVDGPPWLGWDATAIVTQAVDRLSRSTSVEDLAQTLCHVYQEVIGFDRVHVYRFDSDWNGTIIAEHHPPDQDSYLGLYYPESDIPAQARRLYLEARTRVIPDTHYTPVPLIVAADASREPTDLTHAALRSVSPNCLEFMRNMGVRASFGASLIVRGQLWGLVIGHHPTVRLIHPEVRRVCDVLRRFACAELTARLDDEETIGRQVSRNLAELAVASLLEERHGREQELLAAVGAEGVVVCRMGQIWTVGRTPPDDVIRGILAWLAQRSEELLIATDRLGAEFAPAVPHLDTAAGLLALTITRDPDLIVLWFRPQTPRRIRWGGNFQSPIGPSLSGYGPRPRTSFTPWEQVLLGRSEPWTSAQRDAALYLRQLALLAEARRAERMARQAAASDALFRIAFQWSGAGLALTTPDTILLQANPAFAKLLGYDPEELIGTPYPNLVHPDDRAEGIMARQRIVQGQIPSVQLAKRYLHRSGRTLYVLVTVALVRRPDGQPELFVFQVQDVTERTWTERLLGAEKRSVALLSAPTSPEEPVGPLLAILGDALGYARVEFWQLRTGDHQPVRTQHWSRTEPAPSAVQGTRTTDSRLARAFSAQKPVIEADEIVIPVTAGGQTAGVLVLAEPTGDGAPSGSGLETFTQTLAATLGHYLDRQSTEAALRTSEARLHAFLTYLPHPAWVKDQSGRYLIINPAFHAKFLPSGAEALGRTDSQLFPPTVSDLLRRNDRAVFESGRPLPGVMEVPTPHGPRTYMTVKFPFPSPDGQRTVGGVAVDVTDRIAAERQAIAATRLMRTIIDSTAGPISARDRHLRYLLMNRYQAEFLGTTPDSVVGQSVAELLGPEAARRTAARDLEAMTTGHPLTYEETVTDSHGATRTWLTTTTPLPGGPGEPDVVGAVSVSVDITERKATEDALRRSEDQARTLIRAVPMIVFVCDPDARQVLVSDRWFDYTGLRDASDVRWLDLIHPEDVPAAVESWNQSAATGKPYQAEFRFRRADGVYRWHQTRALPLRDGDGTIRQWLGTSVDVDDLKATVRVMDEARAAADAANQAKTEFLANVSHELRTPLAGILGMTELMLVETLPPAQRERLSIVQSSAERLKNLVNDLLDVAKIDAGRLELVASPFDLRHTVQLALTPLELDAQRKGLAFSITIAPDIPQVVVGDAHRLTQVLTNLVDNAIKFTETGDIRVSVDCRSLTDSTAHLDFVVQDTGIGIPGDRLTAIFERFVQAAPGVSRKYGGSGLGLSIARRLVELMGGTLTAQSEPGRGSQFRFDVRLLTASHPAATRLRLSEEPTRALGNLVVDDQPINLRVVGDVLRRAGHRVVTVRDGHEAVEAARRERFDIILMDIQMPELDGFRTTALIRRQEQDTGTNRVPIIALTARAMPGERAECLRAGMDGFISKPIDWPELFRMIADLTQPIPAPGSSEEQAMTDPIRVALQRCGDDPALLAEVVDVFETDAPKFVEEIRGAVAAGNLTLAAEAAHKLVGLAGTLEAGAVVVAARAVETRARQNDLAGTAAELETLTAALADFTPRLTQYRNL